MLKKGNQIQYIFQIDRTQFLDLLLEDHNLFVESLTNADSLERIVGKKSQHYFNQIYSLIKDSPASTYSELNTQRINTTRCNTETNYFILENAKIYNHLGQNYNEFDWLSIIASEPISHFTLKTALENDYFHGIGMQTIRKFKIHELPKEIITEEIIDTMKQNSCVPLNNGVNIHAALHLTPNEKHKHPKPDSQQYLINFGN